MINAVYTVSTAKKIRKLKIEGDFITEGAEANK